MALVRAISTHVFENKHFCQKAEAEASSALFSVIGVFLFSQSFMHCTLSPNAHSVTLWSTRGGMKYRDTIYCNMKM